MSTVARQVRVAEVEAGFALVVTLAVCVRTEWAHGPNGVAMAVVVPVAMAFSVHGLHNAAGLGWWNLVYIPLRLAALIAGLAYSYSHYLAMLPADPLLVAGRDIRWLVAIVVEVLTVSALIAHQAHSTRLQPDPAAESLAGVDAQLVDQVVEHAEPASEIVPAAVSGPRFVPLDRAPVGASSPVSNGSGPTTKTGAVKPHGS
jgi:hypothetical protein